jgi:hypothetical protein
LQHEILVPGVELLESMRSVGYSFHAAIADLVDNSISAGAVRVEIVGDPVDSSFLTVLDDGAGMSPDEARTALQLAGSARTTTRAGNDLGRFGLGLKTASLSQARRLTVLTRKNAQTTALQWDIDHVLSSGEWSLSVLAENEYTSLPRADALLSRPSGTLIVWQELDYMLGAASRPDLVMAERLADLRGHLSLTFHRFLDDGTRSPLVISVNGLDVPALDPFLSKNPRTQQSHREPLTIEGQRIEFQAYTLPHPSALSKKDRERWDLSAGMRERQGFYIYRNRRLISYGHWFGLSRREELSKQSRVMVDIPNTVDHLWQLDIKKSRAEPPQAFRLHFRRVMDKVIDRSKRVHTFRGRRVSGETIARMWDKITDREGSRYQVNAEHPLVAALQETMTDEQKRQLSRLLTDLAQTFPTADLYIEAAKGQTSTAPAAATADVLAQLAALRRSGGFGDLPPAQVASTLRATEPFDRVEDLDGLITQIWSAPA